MSAAARRRYYKFTVLVLMVVSSLGGCITSPRLSVDAGEDLIITQPERVALKAVLVNASPSSQALNFRWRKADGSGSVTFSQPDQEVTEADFSEAGVFILEVLAQQGEAVVSDHVKITVLRNNEFPIEEIFQVGRFETGADDAGRAKPVPSIDPAGLVYHPATDHLILVDSEIEEVPTVFDVVKANVFETSRTGERLFQSWNTVTDEITGDFRSNQEPTGIAFCPTDGHFYMTNDDRDLIYRYALSGAELMVQDTYSLRAYTGDAEDVACDPVTGRLYVIGAHEQIVVILRYQEQFVVEKVLHLAETAAPNEAPQDGEGIAFDPWTRHLLIVSDPDEAIFEFDLAGTLVAKYSIAAFEPHPRAPQGLTLAPSSKIPGGWSLYIIDGGYDNDSRPSERDGAVYEAAIRRESSSTK